jgi:hypothetical protein
MRRPRNTTPQNEPAVKITVHVAKTCYQCGRKLDARMIDNPFGWWSIPTVDGATGRTFCSYCLEVQSGRDPQTTLPAGCEALVQLQRWLELNTK